MADCDARPHMLGNNTSLLKSFVGPQEDAPSECSAAPLQAARWMKKLSFLLERSRGLELPHIVRDQIGRN